VSKHNRKLAHHTNSKQKTPFDYVIYFFSFATPLFELPQAYVIYAHHAAENVSIWSWGFFLIDNIIWILYALRTKMRPLLITSVLYLIIELSVVIGIVIYS